MVFNLVWLRHIDYIFFIWTHAEKELKKILSQILIISRPILSSRMSLVKKKKDISFLDLKVLLSKDKLSIELHIKPTDCHQSLHYSSNPPEHTKRSIVYSQLLSVSRICSRENDFNWHKSNMKIWFQNKDTRKT